MYALALSGLAGYATIGFNVLSNGTTQTISVFSWIGMAYVGMVVTGGLFLVRFAGYIFCSNIMNRKRMVHLRASYSQSHGILDLVPPPTRADDVWICGGYRSFPYLFAIINFSVLFMNVAFLYLLVGDLRKSCIIAGEIILVIATIYPNSCRRYAADIFVAKNFLSERSDFAKFGRDTHKQLKDLYNEVLKEKEKAKRANQVGVLVGYLVSTALTMGLGITYYYTLDNTILLCMVLFALALTAYLRILTVKYRFPPRRNNAIAESELPSS